MPGGYFEFRVVRGAERSKIIDKQRRAVRRQLEKTLGKKVRDQLIEYFEDVVSDWRGKPRFRGTIGLRPDNIMLTVAPVVKEKMGKVFNWIDLGTGLYGPSGQRYPIRPKTAKMLRFRPFYLSRTKPIARAHVGPGIAIGKPVFAKEVMHPGIKPRHFSREVRKKMRPQFRRAIENDLRRAVRRARRTGRVE